MIFISYAREDIDFSKRIYEDLKRFDLTPWLDVENILPGQNWKDEIIKAIKRSSYFLAVISNNSLTKRGFVQKELKIALDILDEVPSSQIFIIPIRIDDCEPEDEKLKSIQRVDFFISYIEGLRKCLKILSPNKVLKYPFDDGERNDLSQVKYRHYKGIDIIDILGDIRADTIETFQKMVERTIPVCKYLIIRLPTNKDFTTIGITILINILAELEKNDGHLAIVCQDEFHIGYFCPKPQKGKIRQ
jgi:hypothetical protein